MILGVANEVPEPKLEPPVRSAYQLIIPALAVALRDTDPIPHLEAGVVEVIVGIGLNIPVNTLDVLYTLQFPVLLKL